MECCASGSCCPSSYDGASGKLDQYLFFSIVIYNNIRKRSFTSKINVSVSKHKQNIPCIITDFTLKLPSTIFRNFLPFTTFSNIVDRISSEWWWISFF